MCMCIILSFSYSATSAFLSLVHEHNYLVLDSHFA